MKALVDSPKLPPPVGPFSPGLSIDNWIFLSGQGGFDPVTGKMISEDVAEQTEQTLRNIETLLQEADLTTDDIVSCLVHLVDLGDFAAFNEVYEKTFTGLKPVRTTVRADLVAGMKVEITVVARKGANSSD